MILCQGGWLSTLYPNPCQAKAYQPFAHFYFDTPQYLALWLFPGILLFLLQRRASLQEKLRDFPLFFLAISPLTLPLFHGLYLILFVVLSLMTHHLRRLLPIALCVPLVLAFKSQTLQTDARCEEIPQTVRDNMHTLRTAVESYAAQHRGQYPANITTLKQSRPEVDVPFLLNPFTRERDALADFYPDEHTERLSRMACLPEHQLHHVLGVPYYRFEKGCYLGKALYYRVSSQHYIIYGGDYRNRLIQNADGSDFILSNH